MTFGKQIARACKEQGVSHGELARRLGQARSRVPEILRSDNITERTLYQCAKALGLKVDMRLVRAK